MTYAIRTELRPVVACNRQDSFATLHDARVAAMAYTSRVPFRCAECRWWHLGRR